MKTILFKTQFADLVASGAKRQTIRPVRRHPVKVGETVSLRRWEGAAYRTHQLDLCTARIDAVTPILVDIDGLRIGRSYLNDPVDLEDQAAADGFASWPAMVAWFRQVHGLPFFGVLIQWTPMETKPLEAQLAFRAPYADHA